MPFLEHVEKCLNDALATPGTPRRLGPLGKSKAGDLFLVAYETLRERFGPPDAPALETPINYRSILEVEVQLFALWEFDYYQLSLRLESDPERDDVVIQRHAPSSMPWNANASVTRRNAISCVIAATAVLLALSSRAGRRAVGAEYRRFDSPNGHHAIVVRFDAASPDRRGTQNRPDGCRRAIAFSQYTKRNH